MKKLTISVETDGEVKSIQSDSLLFDKIRAYRFNRCQHPVPFTGGAGLISQGEITESTDNSCTKNNQNISIEKKTRVIFFLW